MSFHTPVLLNEVVEYLNISDGKTYVDCTFGAGGYTRSILSKADCKVIAIDQDPTTRRFAEKINSENLIYINDNFRNLCKVVADCLPVDGIVYDLGVSSMQLDDGERGFSFQKNAKLDMRMSCNGKSAYEIINNSDESDLADIIYFYGEEHFARRIAKKIIEVRQEKPLETTFELADLVRSICNRGAGRRGKIDPSTKTFQAIRIAVNEEINCLEESLAQIKDALKTGARAAVVTFHGIEDRIVKKFFSENSEPKVARSKYSKEPVSNLKPFKLITKKSIKPSKEEVKSNPRSRSASLRVIEKIEVSYA